MSLGDQVGCEIIRQVLFAALKSIQERVLFLQAPCLLYRYVKTTLFHLRKYKCIFQFVGFVHDVLSAAVPEIRTAVEYVTRFGTVSETITLQDQAHPTAHVVSNCLVLSNSLNNILFAIRDQMSRAPYQISTNMGLLLGFFEANQIIGWTSGRTVPTIQMLQAVFAGHIGNGGVNIAFLLHVHRALDMIYQLRMGVSLYYHHLET